jgi:hypothetical protein
MIADHPVAAIGINRSRNVAFRQSFSTERENFASTDPIWRVPLARSPRWIRCLRDSQSGDAGNPSFIQGDSGM